MTTEPFAALHGPVQVFGVLAVMFRRRIFLKV